MKKIFLVLLTGGFSLFSQGQISEHSNTSMQVLTQSKTPEGFTGSQYLDKNFQQGVILDGEGRSQPAYLRYNAVEEVMEIKLQPQDEKVQVLPRLKNIRYAINGNTWFIESFRNDNGDYIDGYFVSLFEGDKIKLMGKAVPDVREAQIANTGYQQDKPAHIDVEMEYYIMLQDNILRYTRLKQRDIKKIIPQTQEVKSYLSNNKIKDVNDLIGLLKVYDNS